MKKYLKQAYILSILFATTGAVHAQKNNYEDHGYGFNTRPDHPLSLFGSVQSIQIEDSFLIENVLTDTVKVDYTAHRYFYDIHRSTNRVLQLHAPLDTSYDIEYLNYETHFIRKGTWYRPFEQIYTEIDTPNKIVKSFHAKDGKVVRQSTTRYVDNFHPVEEHEYENGGEVMVKKKAYTSDGKLCLDAYKGLYTSFALTLNYKQGKLVKVEMYNSVSSVDNFEKDPIYYKAEAVYGPDGAMVQYTYFERGKKSREELYTYDNKGLLIEGHELNDSQVYTYDTSGNILSAIRKDSSGSLIQQIFYSYNERQDPVKETMDWYEDHTVKTFTYVYDEKGNWVKQFQYEHGKLKAIITRKIEYYQP